MIYLASRSPRRRELLQQIGVPYQIVLFREAPRRGADVDETPHTGEAPHDYVLRMALEKATAAADMVRARRLTVHPVLAADTTVVCDHLILGKPDDAADAARMLGMLAGREHRVLTAVTVARGDVVETRVSESKVWFCALAADEIRRYVATGEPGGKAGAYAVQGRAASFISRIEGSYSGIMGLPLAETADMLRSHGIVVP